VVKGGESRENLALRLWMAVSLASFSRRSLRFSLFPGSQFRPPSFISFCNEIKNSKESSLHTQILTHTPAHTLPVCGREKSLLLGNLNENE